ncbi:unnamed protein product, partial [Chrysoparadoxa australica]
MKFLGRTLVLVSSLLIATSEAFLSAPAASLRGAPTSSQQQLIRSPPFHPSLSASLLTSLTAAPARAATGSGEEQLAIIFDCDGVILESEGLHRTAYNKVFSEFDVDYVWTEDYYDVLQNKIGGGKPKMRFHFGENGWPSSKLGPAPTSDDEQERLIDSLQDRKNEIYKELIAGGEVPVRPGFHRVVKEAAAMPGVKLAICSASTKTSCLFVLDNLLGPQVLSGLLHKTIASLTPQVRPWKHFVHLIFWLGTPNALLSSLLTASCPCPDFELILAGDDVPRRKPDPMIYIQASSALGVPPERCIVVEDSVVGLDAAVGAGMKCIITHTPSTASQDFTRAELVVPELGE